MNQDPRLAAIDRKFMMMGIYNLPGIFCLAGGLLGKFGEPGEIPFAFLADPDTSTALLVLGVISFLWSSAVAIKLTQEKFRILRGTAD